MQWKLFENKTIIICQYVAYASPTVNEYVLSIAKYVYVEALAWATTVWRVISSEWNKDENLYDAWN